MVILFGVDKTHGKLINVKDVIKLDGDYIYVDGVPHSIKDYKEIVVFESGNAIPLKATVVEEPKIEQVGPRLIVPKMN